MLRRKITDKLYLWKKDTNRLPLLINGARQVGKTTAVLEFAKNTYKTIYQINFFETPELVSIFSEDLSADTILTKLSFAFPETRRKEGSTLIFLDEIQHCPNGRTALKFLAKDPRFDVIATGSLLGINHASERSFPVGYINNIELFPLDFEEFLWAMGIDDEMIASLKDCFKKRKAVDTFVHNTMLSYFSLYMAIGGMPAVVNSYAENRDYSVALKIQRNIIADYKKDIVKYAEEDEKTKIISTFDSIPSQLAKDYKKFQYSIINKGARFRNYGGSLLWLKDARIISFCNNLSKIEAPLRGFLVDNEFKVYMNDTGLLVSMYEDGTALKIINGELGLFKGAFYENIIAQSLTSSGFPLYYFSPSDSLEIDFIITFENKICPVEVKSGENKRSKSLSTVLSTEKYGIERAIRISRNNVGEKSGILSLPLYMIMFLEQDKVNFNFNFVSNEEMKKHIQRTI